MYSSCIYIYSVLQQQHHCERVLFVVTWNRYGFALTVYLQQNTAYIQIAIITQLCIGCLGQWAEVRRENSNMLDLFARPCVLRMTRNIPYTKKRK